MFGLNFGKKKDPLADLDNIGDSTETNINSAIPPESNFGTQSGFESPLTSSSDSLSSDLLSGNPNHAQPMQPTSFNQFQNSQPQNQQFSNNKDLELISSKLDVLKSMMENLSQRLSTIEQKIDLENKRW